MHRAALPLDPAQLTDEPGAGPVHERLGKFNNIDVTHPRVGQQRPGGEAQTEPADQNPFRSRMLLKTFGGEQHLGGDIGGVHGKGAVDHQFEDLASASQHHLAGGALGTR